ncbi:MAG: ROK family protein [Thermoplasmata archaeon]|nr:ROK family protein [Thermoplasmata archaeon]
MPESESGPAPLVLGVDLGGTNLSGALVGPHGRLLTPRVRHPHTNRGPEELAAEIGALVVSIGSRAKRPVAAVGVGVAAQVDESHGVVTYAPNLRWNDVPLGPQLERSVGLPVAIVNDARAATVAEWRFGAGKDVSDLLVVFVGTGVGGSLVAGGRLMEGAQGAAGEVGHSILFAGGRKCHCPGRGCLEAYVGGWAIAERAREAVEANPDHAAALRRQGEVVGSLDADAVGRAARDGDPLALGLVEETARWLGEGVAGLVNAYNPSRVVLGGGVVEGWPELLPAVERAIRTHCQPPAAGAEVRRVAFGPNSVLVGAATVARDRLRRLAPT